MPTDHSMMKLGGRPPRIDPRSLKLAKYMTPSLPPPPAQANFSQNLTDWGMFLNDSLSDCTIAAVPHAIMGWTYNAVGAPVHFTDDTALEYYEKWDGYVAGDPSTDNGGVELDVLNKWRAQGFAGHALDMHADVNFKNRAEIVQAIWLFGGLYAGLALPITAQTQDTWHCNPPDQSNDPNAVPGSWGLHCTWFIDYDRDGLTMLTWGQLKRATWCWVDRYTTELHALVSKDFLQRTGKTLAGLDIATMEADLRVVTA